MTEQFDTVILGAGAAGMMCAAHADGRVLVLDHAKAPGEKIRISGGGRCNFTNMYCEADRFLSMNPNFAKSALARYTHWDFLDLVQRHRIDWHEKTLGQLFCDHSAKDIIAMLLAEMSRADLWLQEGLSEIRAVTGGFALQMTSGGEVFARHLVTACGGKSIPKMGATGYGYEIAARFGHDIIEIRPALVPLTFSGAQKEAFAGIAGIAVDVRATAGGASFDEAMLFTHRGLSGPAILQISSYWREGDSVALDLMPGHDALAALQSARKVAP